MKYHIRHIVPAVVSSLLVAAATHAATFPVTNTADTGAGSLRDALAQAAANPGADNIAFSSALGGQTITLASEIGVADADGVTVETAGLVGGLTIDGGPGPNRIFFVSGIGILTLRGLTLTGGNGGGAVLNNRGGAILNRGTLTINSCTFTGNSATLDGGAILNESATLSLTKCIFTSNSSGANGGAVCNGSGTLVVSQCTFSGNSATDGGAIWTVTSTVAEPVTTATTLTQCTIAGNSATTRGGGIRNRSGRTTLTHCTVARNTAPAAAGSGVASYGDANTETVVKYSIIAVNQNSDVDISDGNLAANTFTSQGYNRIGDGNATGDFNQPGDTTGHTPATILLAPLGNYGGPMQTVALLIGSPARNGATGSTITTDQRGFPMVGVPDVGAYEAGTFTDYDAWIYETLPAATAANAAVHASTYDFDGDGITNGNEWPARTNPGDPSSALRITGVAQVAPKQLNLTFPSVPGRLYTVEYTFSLSPAVWGDDISVTATGTTTTVPLIFQDPLVTYPRFFLRIRVGP